MFFIFGKHFSSFVDLPNELSWRAWPNAIAMPAKGHPLPHTNVLYSGQVWRSLGVSVLASVGGVLLRPALFPLDHPTLSINSVAPVEECLRGLLDFTGYGCSCVTVQRGALHRLKAQE